MSEMLSKRLRWGGGGRGGGVRIFWRGVREKGGSSEPPLVTGLVLEDRPVNCQIPFTYRMLWEWKQLELVAIAPSYPP